MTTDEAKAKRATELHEVAIELNEVAIELRGVKRSSVPRWMGYLLLGIGGLLLIAVIAVGVLAIPIVRTANIVNHVAGPDAQKTQATQTQGFLAFFLCTQRENTSEARVLDGRDPLPLRDGCPPYDFDPHRPIILQSPTTVTTSAPRRHTTTTRRSTTSTSVMTPTTTTAMRSTPTTCDRAIVLDRCVNAP